MAEYLFKVEVFLPSGINELFIHRLGTDNTYQKFIQALFERYGILAKSNFIMTWIDAEDDLIRIRYENDFMLFVQLKGKKLYVVAESLWHEWNNHVTPKNGNNNEKNDGDLIAVTETNPQLDSDKTLKINDREDAIPLLLAPLLLATHPIENKPYKCLGCDSRFKGPIDLKEHVRECQAIKGKAIVSKDVCFQRSLERTSKCLTKCDECDSVFNSQGNLNKHMRIHNKCDICDRTFTIKTDLLIHMLSHTDLASKVEMHLRKYNVYTCGNCDRDFKTRKELYEHAPARTHKCNVCDRSFFQKRTLRVHEYSHTPEYPYSCDVCGAMFTELNDLETHRMNHKSENAYKCDECDSDFKCQENLNQHIRERHEDAFPRMVIGSQEVSLKQSKGSPIPFNFHGTTFKCDKCDCAFKFLTHLNEHKRLHNI